MINEMHKEILAFVFDLFELHDVVNMSKKSNVFVFATRSKKRITAHLQLTMLALLVFNFQISHALFTFHKLGEQNKARRVQTT